MKVKSIYVNLAVEDLQRSRDFWTKLGFSFNETFSNDKGICLVMNENLIYAMLLHKDFFATFTDRKIADPSVTQVILAIEADSRETVDKVVQLALDNGATRFKKSQDHGWMYYDSFADPDGHQWEVMWSDPSKLPQQ